MTIKNHPCGEKNLLLIWSYVGLLTGKRGCQEQQPESGKDLCTHGGKFESDILMSLSNGSIGANAPAVAFGKTAALEGV